MLVLTRAVAALRHTPTTKSEGRKTKKKKKKKEKKEERCTEGGKHTVGSEGRWEDCLYLSLSPNTRKTGITTKIKYLTFGNNR